MNLSSIINLDFTIESNVAIVLLGILIIALTFQLYYILIVYRNLAKYKVIEYKDTTDLPPVTIIICANNEEDNLKKYLKTILTQDYPQFEVIVVNDSSTDETQFVLEQYKNDFPFLHIVEIKEHIKLKNSKKFALTLGIKAAKYDHLVLTDADCATQSSFWLREMVGAYQHNTEIVIGYSPYFKEKGFLNKLIRFETTHTAMSYLSYAIINETYMGVGRNLSYVKGLFFKGKGFNAHMHIKSGDDDLFINQNATKTNVNITLHPDSHMYSAPKSTWKSYYKQKARHSGASVLYRNKHKWMLGSQLISATLFYISLITWLILFPQNWIIAIIAYFLRYISQISIFNNIYKKLAVKDLLIWLPILDVFFYFYICFNGLFNRKKKIKTWR